MSNRSWKQLGNLRKLVDHPLGIPETSSSSESTSTSGSSTMPSRAEIPVVTEAPTRILGSGESLSQANGSWADIDYYFVQCLENPQPLEFYYRDLSEVYGCPDGTEGREPYNQTRMDGLFETSPGTRYPCAPLSADMRKFTATEIDDAMKAVFHFRNKMELRWTEPHERIYHRPAGGYVGVSLEHLQGMRPFLHQFTKSLCRYVYRIPFTQLALNCAKWISWFLGCCQVKNYLPTFKLFHHLFQIKKSTSFPLYEFVFRIKDCGFLADKLTAPVMMLNSLRGWHQEFIFIRGGDLEFMPLYKEKIKTDNFPVRRLGCGALAKVHDLCGALGQQWTRDAFLDNSLLHGAGCKFFR